MKKTTKILSASLIVAFATPMFASANFQGNGEKRGEFEKMTIEERIEKVNSNESLTDEEKAERITKMQEMGENFQKMRGKNLEGKEAAGKFFEKSKKERREKITVEERIEKINSNEDLTDEEKAERIAKMQEMESKMAEKKAEMEEISNIVKESISQNSNISDEKKADILEKIGGFFGKFFR